MMDQSDQDLRHRLLVARLPAMPPVLVKLIEHLQVDDLGMMQLAALIASDAGISAKILAVANRASDHRPGRVESLEQSLMALGTDTVKTLVISEAMFQTFRRFPHVDGVDLRRFWRHSLSAAVLARDLARRMAYPHLEQAYLAGLLHNIGRLALLTTAPQQYTAHFNAHDDAALCAVEQHTLYITHAEAGAWLIERWNLDAVLADAVLCHHEASARLESSHPLTRIVRLAHLIASDPADVVALADAARLCALSPGEIDVIGIACARQVEQSAAQLGIELADVADSAAAPAPAPFDPQRQRPADQLRNRLLPASGVAGSESPKPGEA